MSQKRPNFIVIMTDQHRADYLGCYGHPFVQTPAIDSLAERGTRFSRFYVNSPVCMPNRASYATGRLPSVCGARGNGHPLPENANTFIDLLRTKGYRTSLVGKSHLMTMTDFPPAWNHEIREGMEPAGDGFEEARRTTTIDSHYNQENPKKWSEEDDWKLKLPFYGFEKVFLCTGHGDTVGGEYVHWLKREGIDRGKTVGPENALESDTVAPQAWRTAIPEEFYPTSYIRKHSLQMIDEYAEEDSDDPFFMMVSFPDPHHPFTPPGKYWDMYSADQVELPENFHVGESNAPGPVQRARQILDEYNMDPTKTMVILPAGEQETKEAIALTCGMITMIDDAVAEILVKLKEKGMDEDTVIIFTADHGDFLGQYGLLLKGPLHAQSIIRVPFIYADPYAQGASLCEAVSGTMDISQTILSRAGIGGYHGMQGRSLLPEIETGHDHGRGAWIVEEESQWAMFGLEPPVRVKSLVTEDWRVSLYDGSDLAEMYNLKNDPFEMNNLWNDSDHVAVQAELMERMARELIYYTDLSPQPRRRA